MRGGDGGTVADGLGAVFVRLAGVGAVVGAVDGGHGGAHGGGVDEGGAVEVADQVGVGAAGAAPGHCGWGMVWLRSSAGSGRVGGESI